MVLHPFDEAIALHADGPDVFAGHCGAAYWNMVGPFGGVSAATALRAVLQHPALLGEPLALTVNYAAALTQGPFRVLVRAARTNRSTQHWTVELLQTDTAGVTASMLTATVVTAVRRTTWNGSDIAPPPVPPPSSFARSTAPAAVEWFNRYEVRTVAGGIPAIGQELPISEPGGQASLTQLWMRDDPLRDLDHCSLAALADVFYPRIFLRRGQRVPVGTVSMTVYFHVGRAVLCGCGSGFVLGQARAQVYGDGFFDQTAQLWSESGLALATSSQIVYFKD
ncbi:MAG: thioesterase family protein [Rhodoferax sp.]|nr:thioesterase family protein [Rhodoferax sp.]